jgi:hypothetical protein
MKKILFTAACLSLLLFNNSCKDEYLERVPTTSVAESDIFGTVTGVNTVLEGIHRSTYRFYGSHDRFGQEAVNMAVDLLGEDFYQTERGYGWFVSWYQYIEHRNINSGNLEWIWAYYYDIIDNANAILANINKASDVALYATRVNNIKGQALTYRAYSLYQMVQLYADRYVQGGANTHLGIPLVLVPTQEGLPRSTVAEVYAQINTDLDAAIAAFGAATGVSRPSKMEININVAKGMKARVALTMGQYAIAETMAKEARTGYTLTTAFDKGFRDINDAEWMWGADLITEQQTSYASFFSHIDPAFGGYATLGNHKLASTTIFDFMSATDIRKSLFTTIATKPRVGSKFSGFGDWTNDYLYMRAAEMYLIEAESQARQGKDADAQTTINTLVVARDKNYVKPALTGDALIAHILMQRRCELWGEGQRFFDIKRLNIDMDRRGKGHTETLWSAAGYFPAGDKNMTFLIPKQEIDANPKMVQNPL